MSLVSSFNRESASGHFSKPVAAISIGLAASSSSSRASISVRFRSWRRRMLGIVEGNLPPSQRLFELGGDQSLPGYDYKEFVGNRAALFRLFTSYRLQIWQRPRRVWRNFLMPGVSPGLPRA